ncbi:MAG: bifunctional 4-hydroxy-2-oxoglutarate aldolase/2-dehydro-3-deoxy-phosphogluconate aldolase [Thermonemataceae bacterium]
MKRIEVTLTLQKTKIVPVFYHPDTNIGCSVLQLCYDHGIRIFEFTNRGIGAHEVFRALKAYAVEHCPALYLGIGTVVEAGTAALFLQEGADFVVSPVLSHDIFKVCNRRKVLHIPGCATLSEISQAEEYGAEIVKVFPGDVLSPKFVKGLKGPMPWTNVMVTGGVTPEEDNLSAWFEAGVTAVGMGSKLFSKAHLANKNFEAIGEQLKKTIQIINSLP